MPDQAHANPAHETEHPPARAQAPEAQPQQFRTGLGGAGTAVDTATAIMTGGRTLSQIMGIDLASLGSAAQSTITKNVPVAGQVLDAAGAASNIAMNFLGSNVAAGGTRGAAARGAVEMAAGPLPHLARALHAPTARNIMGAVGNTLAFPVMAVPNFLRGFLG